MIAFVWGVAIGVLLCVIWHEAGKADRAEAEMEERACAWRTGAPSKK